MVIYFFQVMDLVLSNSNESRPSTIQLSLYLCTVDDHSIGESQNLHPQIMLVTSSEHVSYEVACNSEKPAKSSNCHTLFLTSLTFLLSSNLLILSSHKYPCFLVFEMIDLKIVLLSPLLSTL